MADLMCPVRVVCLPDSPGPDGVAALRALGVRRLYAPPPVDAVRTLAGALGVDVEAVPGLAAPEPDPSALLPAWLLDGELDRRAGGETGRELLDRFAAALTGIADRHRGETVAVRADPTALTLTCATIAAGLAPAAAVRRPSGEPITVEYDGELWRHRPDG